MKRFYFIILTIVLFILFNFSCAQGNDITHGTYVTADDAFVFLIIRPDTSFRLQANFCEGFGSYYGAYRQEKNTLICVVQNVDFKNSGWEEIKEFRFKITSKTNLQYLGEQVACGPYEETVLKKCDDCNEDEEDMREDITDNSSGDIFIAAAEGNIEAVKNYIENGAAVDSRNEFNWTPLVFAVDEEQEKVVEYLIEMGADVNEYQYATGIGWDTSIFELAMNTGNQKIIDLIVNADIDEQIVMSYYNDKLYEYLSMDETEMAEALLKEGKARFTTNQILLVHYSGGSGGVRKLIRKYGPAEIVNGSINLLDEIIPGSISFDYEMYDISILFPISTTFKYDEIDPLRFSPEKAFDSDNNTSWQEGVEGSGIGEKIAFYAEKGINLLSIIPGIVDKDNFKKYNRVKKAHLRFYMEQGDVGQIRVEFTYESAGDEYELNFDDIMDIQEFPIQLPELPSDESSMVNIVCVLEIAAVYPGTEYDDTCITEIRLDADTRYGN